MTEKIFSHYTESGAVFMDPQQTLSEAKIAASRIVGAAEAEAVRLIQTAQAEAKRITDAAVLKIRNAGG
jgi:hypothetical protein